MAPGSFFLLVGWAGGWIAADGDSNPAILHYIR